MTTTFDLIFKTQSKNDPPFTPYANICLKKTNKDEEGNILISPNLYSSEFDSYIDNLIDELNEIRKKAQKKFLNNG